MRAAPLALAAVALLALHEPGARAADEPLWEAGAGFTVLDFPDYRGASRSRAFVLPFPYLIYRGRFLRQDRRGLRGVFFENDRVNLNLTAGASLPVNSSRDPVREGMPDLSGSVELGPSLDIGLWEAPARRARLELRLPLRGAVTVERHPRYIGLQFSPNLNLDVSDAFGQRGWNLGMLFGPVFTDRRYDRYFYQVPEANATAGRPAYEAPGGYAGMEYIVALSKRYRKFWVGGFARYDTLGGAAFASSPLVTSRRYAAGGVAVAWIFGESRDRVPVNALGEPIR